MNPRREIGEALAGHANDADVLLAAQLAAVQEDLKQRARPYALLAEYRRRVEIAEAFVQDMACRCGQIPVGTYQRIEECEKHFLLRVLGGDE